jgi:hypothetical protein
MWQTARWYSNLSHSLFEKVTSTRAMVLTILSRSSWRSTGMGGVHIIFHKSPKWKVHGCQIGWFWWPWNVAATTYPYSWEYLVQVPCHIPVTGWQVLTCCQITLFTSYCGTRKFSSISQYMWPAMVALEKKKSVKLCSAYSTENIHLRTVMHMFNNLVQSLWSPDDRLWQFTFPDKWMVALSLKTILSKNKLSSSRWFSVSVQKSLQCGWLLSFNSCGSWNLYGRKDIFFSILQIILL